MVKNCAKCKAEFECKTDAIESCHCNSIKLSTTQIKHLKNDFDNCLCTVCLTNFSKEKIED